MSSMDSVWLGVGMSIGGYVLGSIPSGVMVCKCLGAVDPRTAGSRNVGFTNVLRVAGKKAGLLTLAGDMGKGWLVAWGAAKILESEVLTLVVALSPVLGHLFSIFLAFRGGKGVATALGSVIGVAPSLGLLTVLVWLMTVGVWKYSSGGALAAFALLPIASAAFQRSWEFILFTLTLSGLIWWRHLENLKRLWRGTEPKIGQRPAAMS